jgi:hypothetical protein
VVFNFIFHICATGSSFNNQLAFDFVISSFLLNFRVNKAATLLHIIKLILSSGFWMDWKRTSMYEIK